MIKLHNNECQFCLRFSSGPVADARAAATAAAIESFSSKIMVPSPSGKITDSLSSSRPSLSFMSALLIASFIINKKLKEMSQALSQALHQTRCVQHSLSEYLHYIFEELLIEPVNYVGGSEDVPARRENDNTKARMRLVELGGLAFATASSPLLVLKTCKLVANKH